VVRLLGRGGMGEVYEAEHLDTHRCVALKVLNHTLATVTDRARFLREGQLAASVNHPNSVYVFATEEIDGTLVIVMELASGGTLKDVVHARGPMPPAAAVDAILQVIDGLEAAAAIGVLHRDVKPSNCFVDSDGTVKIGDFGLSIPAQAQDATQLTLTGTVLGTPAFAPPEQLRGESLDVRSDLYATGATLYYLLTGQPPFAGDGVVQVVANVLGRDADSPKRLRPDLPDALAQVVQRCLAKDPEERYQTIKEVAIELKELRRELENAGINAAESPLPATELGALVRLIDGGNISGKQGKDVLVEMFKSGKPAQAIIEEQGLVQVSDTGEIDTLIDGVIAANADALANYRAGKEALFGFFVGQVIKASKGKANPKVVNERLRAKLNP